MKNVEIAEGGIGRRLSGTKFVLTDKPESDQMEVWVDEDDRKLARLYATSNGTYYPEDYDAYGFSSVTVSIHGGVALPEMPKIEMPDGIEYPALIPEIEMPDGTLKPIDELFPEIAEDPLADIGEVKMPDTVGEEGSALTGIDPEDGYTYKVEVDEAGNLDIEKVPTGIKITQAPDTEYTFGQDIDPNDFGVQLVDKDGNVVKTKEYPTGTVPIDDAGMDIPDKAPTKEEAQRKGTWTVKTDLFDDFHPTCTTAIYGKVYHTGQWLYYATLRTFSSGVILLEGTSGGWWVGYVFSASSGPVSYTEVTYVTNRDGDIVDVRTGGGALDTGPYTHNGKTVYYGYFAHHWGGFVEHSPDVDPNDNGFTGGALGVWAALYGRTVAEEEINANWRSPYSGVVYSDGTEVIISDPYEGSD